MKTESLSKTKAKALCELLSKTLTAEEKGDEENSPFIISFRPPLCAPVIKKLEFMPSKYFYAHEGGHKDKNYSLIGLDNKGRGSPVFVLNKVSGNSLIWKFNSNFQKKKVADEKARMLFKKYAKAYAEYFSVDEELRAWIPFPTGKPESSRLFLENIRRLAECVTSAKRDAKEYYFGQVAKENNRLQCQLKDKVDALLLDSYPEGGKKKAVQHLVRERNSKLIEAAKALYRRKNPKMPCEACGFSFVKRYGERGEDFIEGHHKIPISEMTEKRKMKPSEIALVCANCHRMIHRTRPWLSVEELKKILQPCKG